MANIIDSITSLLKIDQLDADPNYDYLSNQLGVKPSAIFLAIATFSIIVTLISNAHTVVVALCCCIVPGYLTLMAAQYSVHSHQKYVVYWITYTLLEIIAPFLLVVCAPIIYVLLRIGFTVALLYPDFTLS